MDKMETTINDICCMEDSVIAGAKSYIARGLDSVDTHELYEVVDIIKDLAEAKRNCYEAEYYKTVIEAMDSGDESRMDIMGYNSNRSASTGRYISGNRGSRMGYRPYVDQMPYVKEYLNNPDFEHDMRMGYINPGDYDMHETSERMPSRHGMAYDKFQQAKRHYTTSNSSADKQEMDEHTKEYVMDTMMALKEMYSTSDPMLKKKMKEDLTKLVGEMTV